MSRVRLHDRSLEADMAILLTERRLALRTDLGCAYHDTDFSQGQVAERIGVSHVAVCRWETGETFPGSWAMWGRWARAVNAKFIPPRIET